MIRLRTAAIGALLLSLMLNACSSGAGGMLPTAQNPGGMQSLSGGTAPQSTGRLPISVNCPSIAASGAARIGRSHTPSVHRMGNRPAELVGAGTTALPVRQGCGNGIARPKRTMAWSGCSSGQQDFGCNAHQSPGDGMVWVPEACAWLAGYQGQESCTPGFWESGCAAMGLPDNCGGGGSGYTPGGPPCQPISSCIAWPGRKAQFGDQCTAGTLSIGQEVPGYGDTNHLASGTWSVDVSSGSALDVIGYIYPTLGGTAYFVPLSSSVGVAVFGISFNSSVPVGSNSSISSLANIEKFLSQHLLHGLKLGNPVNCYPGGNWNGKYPS